MIAYILLALLLLFVAVVFGGRWRWQRLTESRARRLETQRLENGAGPVVSGGSQATEGGAGAAREGGLEPLWRVEDLPDPVRRWLEQVLPAEGRRIRSMRMEQDGVFNLGGGEQQWRSFRAQQRVVTEPPGFLWDAAISMLPALPVRVHDAYIGGEGILHATLAGTLTVASPPRGRQAAEAELLRFLAEAPWCPTVLLPSERVSWRGVDDREAEVRLSDGDIEVSMRYRFGTDGLVESVRADARGRTVAGRLVATPWEGLWWNYARMDGVLIPTSGEVRWILEEGPMPYWQGRVSSISYEWE